MAELKVCRICLRTEAKMYQINQFQLKFYYEEVMALKTNEEDGLPQYFCYECATVLHKFHKFKEKCYIGQKVLKELLWRGPITYESVYKIDRADSTLKSPLAIITISNRIRTYTIKHNNVSDDVDEHFAMTENVETEYFSEGSVTDREDQNASFCDMISDDERISENKKMIDYTEISNDEKICEDEKMSDNKKIINRNKIGKKRKTKKHEDNKNIIGSPMVVYIEAENGILATNATEFKEKKKNISNKMFALLSNKNHWKIIILSEEDALREFREKAEDKKYVVATYKCKECFKWFSKKDMLDRHVRLRHIQELGNHECRFCHYRYRIECYLTKHMKQHYTRFECVRCDFKCSAEQSATFHEEYHSGVTRKCTYCDEEFRHSSTYYTHLRTHRSEHVCTLCGASFVSPLGLHQHKTIKHVITEIESPDDDEEVNTYCKRCDIRFETRKAYEEHLFHSALHSDEEGNKITNVVLDENGGRDKKLEKVSQSKKILGKKVQAKITKELRKRGNTEDPFVTSRCTNRKRRNRRQPVKPTTCYQCGKFFPTQAACFKHHTEAHPRTSLYPPNERFICEICGASLAPGSVATHQNMHTRETLHTCDTCGRQFHTFISLKRHMVTHTGEKPYGCPLCDKRFTQSNSMKLHYRTFHLKQPYPKRNRRKKFEPKETEEIEKPISEESSDNSQPDATRDPSGNQPSTVTPPRDESLHYLTLA